MDYHGALESIHAYFDLSCVYESESVFKFQYAVLNLALLHFAFGYLDPCENVSVFDSNIVS